MVGIFCDHVRGSGAVLAREARRTWPAPAPVQDELQSLTHGCAPWIYVQHCSGLLTLMAAASAALQVAPSGGGVSTASVETVGGGNPKL